MTRFTFLLVVGLLLSSYLSAQGDGPCLWILQNGSDEFNAACGVGSRNAAANSDQRIIQFRHPNSRASVDNEAGWLKAFWIFGDGNFAAFEDGGRTVEERSLNVDYVYGRSGKFTVIPLMVEKKTNGIPPGYSERELSVRSPSIGVKQSEQQIVPFFDLPATFRQQLTPGETANLLNSSKVRLGNYETALAVSAKMPSKGVSSISLLYYNSIKQKDSALFENGEIFKPGDLTVRHANYTQQDTFFVSTPNNLPVFVGGAAAARQYKNVLLVPMDYDPARVSPGFTEHRYFPLFTPPTAGNKSFNTGILPLDTTGVGVTQFAVLVLQNAIPVTDSAQTVFVSGQGIVDSITTVERDSILAKISRHLPWLNGQFNPQNLQINNTEFFIRGVHYLQTDVVAVIDPTQLVVHKICPDEQNAGLYDVDATLTVCNEGNMTERKVVVNLFKAPGMVISDLTFDANQITADLVRNEADTFWRFSYEKNGGLAGAYEEGAFNSSCFDVNFKVKTDWAGAQRLATGKGMTAKVHFTSAQIKAIQFFPNLPFEPNQLTQEKGYRCGPPDTESCWWLWVVLFALAVVAWWYWKNQNEYPPTA